MNYNRLHQSCLVVDAHCDTLTVLQEQKRELGPLSQVGHIDLSRLKDGGVNVQFFAIFIHPMFGEQKGIERTLEIIDLFYRQLAQYDQQLALASSKKSIEQIVQQGKIAAVLSIEGGEALGGKIHMLNIYHKLGVRCLTLTWNGRNSLADGVNEDRTKGGLTRFGIEVVEKMNQLGMLIDVSHLSSYGFWDVLSVSTKPVLATHSNCATLCSHQRNLTDQQIISLADKGGVIGLTLVPQFISANKPSLERYLDHIDYVVNLIGNTKHIGIGTDFDGVDKTLPELSDCSQLSLITEGLSKRGYDKIDIENILGGNLLRVFGEVVG